MLDGVIPVIGAVIVIGSTMVTGLRVHRFGLRYAPTVFGTIPRGTLETTGLVIGALIVARWLT